MTDDLTICKRAKSEVQNDTGLSTTVYYQVAKKKHTHKSPLKIKLKITVRVYNNEIQRTANLKYKITISK